MKNYTDDPQLRSLGDIVSDPKNKLTKIKFAKGALYKDTIYIHPTNDSIDKKIYFAFIRASKLLISSAYQRYICTSTIKKAKQFNFDLNGAVMASDAFFPFPDCVEIAKKVGVTSILQPGGSIKDKLSIDYCNKNELSMVFTGTRHFKH